MKGLNKLRDRAYKNAIAHGWHEEKHSEAHWSCLVISELMEAVQADRKDRHGKIESYYELLPESIACLAIGEILSTEKDVMMAVYEETIKDTVEDELADACIRLLDCAGLENYDLENYDYDLKYSDVYSKVTFTEAMYNITRYVMRWNIPEILNEIFAFCKGMNIEIFWYIKHKMKYNELRPYKHGKRY